MSHPGIPKGCCLDWRDEGLKEEDGKTRSSYSNTLGVWIKDAGRFALGGGSENGEEMASEEGD